MKHTTHIVLSMLVLLASAVLPAWAYIASHAWGVFLMIYFWPSLVIISVVHIAKREWPLITGGPSVNWRNDR